MLNTKPSVSDLYAPAREGLTAVEERMREYGPDQHESLSAAIDHILASGGKRIRPAMSLLASGIFSANFDHAVSLAAAVEMLHTASLVHDDLVDGALLRRGVPTLNASWSPGATVLTGDYVFARAADFAARTNNVRVMHIFSRTLMVLVNGEIHQMFKSKGMASREDYYRRIYAKTASVFEAATEAAGVIGGATEDQITALAVFGREVGSAFQIVDDILDFIGEENHIGKPVGGDLRQGLVTLPTLYYMDERPNDPDLLALLDGKMGDVALTATVVEAIRKSKAIHAALDEAKKFVARGVAALEILPKGVHRDSLRGIAEYVVSRDL